MIVSQSGRQDNLWHHNHTQFVTRRFGAVSYRIRTHRYMLQRDNKEQTLEYAIIKNRGMKLHMLVMSRLTNLDRDPVVCTYSWDHL